MQTGLEPFLHKKNVNFLRRKDGTIFPAEIYIKFHFSLKYDYTYLAMIKPLSEMSPFNSNHVYSTKQLCFFNTDFDNGNIIEVS